MARKASETAAKAKKAVKKSKVKKTAQTKKVKKIAKAPAKVEKTEKAEKPEKVELAVKAPVVEPTPAAKPAPSRDHSFTVKLSTPLARRILAQAEEEGLAIEELIKEFISESVVLRAFEIAERRMQLKAPSQGNQNQHNNNNHSHNNNSNNNNRGGRNNKGFSNNRRGGMSNSRYNNIMDDNSSFLEYVRNQEKRNSNR